jgi:small subunit ribosomal protein S3
LGHKTHPIGFRLGFIKEWDAKWYAERDYTELLHEDIEIRQYLIDQLYQAGIPRIEIERSANHVTIGIQTAKPGIVIGRSGVRVEQLRRDLEAKTGKRIRINIVEVRQPETNATLVAQSIADQIERRISYRRAMKQSVNRAMQRGAGGIKVVVAGRLGGHEMSRREREVSGKVPLHTLRADIDYGTAEALTTYGVIGVKVWIYHGEILPEGQEKKMPQAPPVPVVGGIQRQRAPQAGPASGAVAPKTASQPPAPQPSAATEGSTEGTEQSAAGTAGTGAEDVAASAAEEPDSQK